MSEQQDDGLLTEEECLDTIKTGFRGLTTILTGWLGKQVRVDVQGKTYSGKLITADSDRLVILDDMRFPHILCMQSGLVLTGPQEPEQ